jgi:hypothetical protein
MLLRPGDGDTRGGSGNDPTHHLGRRAVFCLAAGIQTNIPVHGTGCDGLLLRMEKAALLASLAAARGSLRRLGASLWVRRRRRDITLYSDVNHAYSNGHYFDGDRDGNLWNPTGNGDHFAHAELRTSAGTQDLPCTATDAGRPRRLAARHVWAWDVCQISVSGAVLHRSSEGSLLRNALIRPYEWIVASAWSVDSVSLLLLGLAIPP